MGDLENRLRRSVTSHADAYSPSADLADIIHARVERARRRHRRRVMALSSGLAVAAAIVVGVYLAHPLDDGSVRTADGRDPSTLTTPGTPPPSRPSTPPIPGIDNAPTATSEPSETIETHPDQPPTDSPTTEPPPAPSTPPTTASTPTTSSSPGPTTAATALKPPDSQRPAAGTCPAASGAVAEITLYPDVPSPRCTQVRPDQTLRVRNASGQQVDVALADFSATLAPGATRTHDRPFGSYLAPGVHRVSVSIYGSSGPELWLVS